jgi:hypothetical protein
MLESEGGPNIDVIDVSSDLGMDLTQVLNHLKERDSPIEN